MISQSDITKQRRQIFAVFVLLLTFSVNVMFEEKVVFVKSSMLVVQISKNKCKAWHMAAYLGVLCPV